MKKNIYRFNWNEYSWPQARRLFELDFGTERSPNSDGSFVTVLPDQELFNLLRAQERALLECLENRSSSTVYRIKELATIHQVAESGNNRQFKDFEKYLQAPENDQLLIQFHVPAITFSVEPIPEGGYLVKHNKNPRFVTHYYPESGYNTTTSNSPLLVEEWLDPEPDEEKKQKLIHKLGIFLRKYLKD